MTESEKTSYTQTLTSWALQVFSLATNVPDVFEEFETKTSDLLQGFTYHSEDRIEGTVEAIKVREVVKVALEPLIKFFASWVAITGALFFASRMVSCLPIIPNVLLVLSLFSGVIVWDIHSLVKGIRAAYTHLNRIHLQGITCGQEDKKALPPKLNFEQIVDLIESYSQQILCDTWLISQNNMFKRSLLNAKPCLTERVKNLGKPEQERKSPWQIANKYFPFLSNFYSPSSPVSNTAAPAPTATPIPAAPLVAQPIENSTPPQEA